MVDWFNQFEAITGYRNLLAIYGREDHGGGPTEDMIKHAEEYKKFRICPNIVMTMASDYINSIPKDLLENIPVWDEELYLEYRRGKSGNE